MIEKFIKALGGVDGPEVALREGSPSTLTLTYGETSAYVARASKDDKAIRSIKGVTVHRAEATESLASGIVRVEYQVTLV